MSGNIAFAHFLGAVCIDPDQLYLATQLDSLNSEETACTRMSILDLTEPNQWGYHDDEDNIVSVHAYRGAEEKLPDESRYLGLSRRGTVRFNHRNTPTFEEGVPEAGMLGGNFGGLMTYLRLIDGQLWACGQHGENIARFDGKKWVRVKDPDNGPVGK